MRSFIQCCLMLLVASVASAQGEKAKGPTRSEFRVGGFMQSGERSFDYGGSVKTGTGSVKGVEVLMRAPVIGLYVRSLSGTFGKQPQVISADARVLLFPPVFTLFGGVGKRALSSALATKQYNVVSAGISSTMIIGGSGLRTHVSAAAMVAKDAASKATGSAALKETSSGMEGEASIYYRLPMAPLFLTLGYRTEVFTGKQGTVESPEEVRGLRIGGGIQFGGH